jgi:RNA polymerase sigma-70 factor (ECF subfamily)
MTGNSSETSQLLERVAHGDTSGWGDLLARHRNRLRRMVALRMDRRLQGRIDASDVIQEAHIEAWTRLAEYVRNPKMPFFLWLRFLAGQRLVTLHRKHFGVQMRDPALEVPFPRGGTPGASSAALAAQLMGHDTRPSEAAMRAEMRNQLRDALDTMESLDREILAMRHLEQLSRAECAHLLEISEAAVSKRYFRALKRLKELLRGFSGGSQAFQR